MKKGKMEYNYIPPELISEILSWLPVKSLGRFTCVSKAWYGLINDKDFIKFHLSHHGRSMVTHSNANLIVMYSFKPKVQRNVYCFHVKQLHTYNYHVGLICFPKDIEPDNNLIVGSCNGLLCIANIWLTYNLDGSDINFCLYNPVTRAYKSLPRLPYSMETEFYEQPKTMSFGYDSVSDDYKVLYIAKLWSPKETKLLGLKSLLYSLKTNEWEIIENPPWDVNVLGEHDSILANNSFHWLSPECKEIKCFNLFTRRYYEIQLPEEVSSTPPILTVLQGQLCIVTYYLDIWILKEYSEEKSWTKLFRNIGGSFHSFDIHKNWKSGFNIDCLKDGSNIILVFSNGIRRVKEYMICCDLESEAVEKIDMMSGLPLDTELPVIQPWVESLVSLH